MFPAEREMAALNILTYSSLFPNAVQPSHGIFVRTRLNRLLASADIEAKVLAPVAWYPRSLGWPKKYAGYAQVPAVEDQDGLTVLHPRYFLIPKVGMTTAPLFMMKGSIGAVRALINDGFRIDAIDAHYFYPDGVAAAMIGKALGIPVTITARGTDINLIPKFRIPRRLILGAARQAHAVFTVCSALKDELVRLGADPSKIVVARNGVDLELFRPDPDREGLRRQLGMSGLCLCSVGLLIRRKGHELCIGALRGLPGATLYIIGDGPEREALGNLANSEGVAERVRFVGRVGQTELKNFYAASDALMLASDREGWANVLLESMACGTPVVATAIWGTPEVVSTPEAGELVHERSAAGLAAGVRTLVARQPDRARTRAYAEGFSWDKTSALQAEVFSRAQGRVRS